MKIGIFIKNYAVGTLFDANGVPNKSGAEFHAENHAKLFIEQGHTTYVMTKKNHLLTKGREVIDKIDVVRLHAPFRWLEIFLRLYTTHKNTDVFYILGVPKFAVWAIKIAHWQKKPVTLVLTSSVEIFDRNANWRNKILAQCDNYIANSREMAEGLRNRGLISESKIHILPHGIDTKRFYPITEDEKKNLRKTYNLEPDIPVILFCARIVPNKGIKVMLNAWRIVHKRRPDAVLLVVGGGLYTLIEEIKRVSREEVHNSIVVIGEVAKTDEYYRVSDMYLFPSEFEGLSTTLMESMASGLPGIASDIGGNRDLIEPGKTGYLIEMHDASAFAQHILKLIKNKELRMTMGATAREQAVHKLDSHKLSSSLLRILKTKDDR